MVGRDLSAGQDGEDPGQKNPRPGQPSTQRPRTSPWRSWLEAWLHVDPPGERDPPRHRAEQEGSGWSRRRGTRGQDGGLSGH